MESLSGKSRLIIMSLERTILLNEVFLSNRIFISSKYHSQSYALYFLFSSIDDLYYVNITALFQFDY